MRVLALSFTHALSLSLYHRVQKEYFNSKPNEHKQCGGGLQKCERSLTIGVAVLPKSAVLDGVVCQMVRLKRTDRTQQEGGGGKLSRWSRELQTTCQARPLFVHV